MYVKADKVFKGVSVLDMVVCGGLGIIGTAIAEYLVAEAHHSQQVGKSKKPKENDKTKHSSQGHVNIDIIGHIGVIFDATVELRLVKNRTDTRARATSGEAG